MLHRECRLYLRVSQSFTEALRNNWAQRNQYLSQAFVKQLKRNSHHFGYGGKTCM